ncbi:MAG: nitroreductase [Clostridium sp.]|nr:nitroreductase [Clostridium sp.]
MKDLKEIYENRRAVNFFDKSKKIEDKTLEDIINLAVLAPSAFNLQPWKIIAF